MAYASLEEIKAANMSSTKLDNSLGGDRNVPYRQQRIVMLTPVVEVLTSENPNISTPGRTMTFSLWRLGPGFLA